MDWGAFCFMPSNAKKIRILVVDDHPGLREGIRAIVDTQPDMVVVGEAADGEAAIVRFSELRPDITVIDVNLPRICGIDVVTAIRAQFAEARAIVATALDDGGYLAKALTVGAQGILPKESMRRLLLPAIRAVHAGQRYVPPEIAVRLPPGTL
jgi:DNA-binding NarL/FixJ family response regulator